MRLSRRNLPIHHDPSPALRHSIKSPSTNPRSRFVSPPQEYIALHQHGNLVGRPDGAADGIVDIVQSLMAAWGCRVCFASQIACLQRLCADYVKLESNGEFIACRALNVVTSVESVENRSLSIGVFSHCERSPKLLHAYS